MSLYNQCSCSDEIFSAGAHFCFSLPPSHSLTGYTSANEMSCSWNLISTRAKNRRVGFGNSTTQTTSLKKKKKKRCPVRSRSALQGSRPGKVPAPKPHTQSQVAPRQKGPIATNLTSLHLTQT